MDIHEEPVNQPKECALSEPGTDSFNIPLEFTVTSADGQLVNLKITIAVYIEFADLLLITLQMDAADLQPAKLRENIAG